MVPHGHNVREHDASADHASSKAGTAMCRPHPPGARSAGIPQPRLRTIRPTVKGNAKTWCDFRDRNGHGSWCFILPAGILLLSIIICIMDRIMSMRFPSSGASGHHVHGHLAHHAPLSRLSLARMFCPSWSWRSAWFHVLRHRAMRSFGRLGHRIFFMHGLHGFRLLIHGTHLPRNHGWLRRLARLPPPAGLLSAG